MMFCKVRLIGLAFLLLTFGSCTSVYLPSTANTMIFEEKGHVEGTAFLGWEGIGLQVGHSFQDHMAYTIQASYLEFTGLYRTTGDASFVLYNSSENTYAGISAGIAATKSRVVIDDYSWTNVSRFYINSTYVRPYSQLTLGLRSEKVELGLAGKLAYLGFLNYEPSNNYEEPRTGHWYAEGAGFFNFKLDHRIYFYSQLQLSLPVSQPLPVFSAPLNFTVGVNYKIHP